MLPGSMTQARRLPRSSLQGHTISAAASIIDLRLATFLFPSLHPGSGVFGFVTFELQLPGFKRGLHNRPLFTGEIKITWILRFTRYHNPPLQLPDLPMENVTKSAAVAIAASLANETVTPAVQGTAGSILVFIAWICGISVVLWALFRYVGLPMLGFVPYGIAAASFAAGWMSSIGLVAAGSVFALLQSIAMGGGPAFTVLLCIFAVVALAVGAFQAILWLIHSASSGNLHLWGTWLVESRNSICEWVHHLWSSIPAHHKWKILYN